MLNNKDTAKKHFFFFFALERQWNAQQPLKRYCILARRQCLYVNESEKSSL